MVKDNYVKISSFFLNSSLNCVSQMRQAMVDNQILNAGRLQSTTPGPNRLSPLIRPTPKVPAGELITNFNNCYVSSEASGLKILWMLP